MDDNYKIFEGGSVEDCLRSCLEEGRWPLNAHSIMKGLSDRTIPEKDFYDTSTVEIDDKRRDATFEELNNIRGFYKKGGSIISVSKRPKKLFSLRDRYADDEYGTFGKTDFRVDGRIIGISSNVAVRYSVKEIETAFKNLKLEGLTEIYIKELKK